VPHLLLTSWIYSINRTSHLWRLIEPQQLKMSEIEIEAQHGSLISIGLREASTRPQPRIATVKFKDLDPDTMQSKRVTAIEIYEVTTPKPTLELLGRPLSPTPKRRIFKREPDVSKLTARQKWGFPETLTKPICSNMSEHVTVQKGFGRFITEKEPVVFEERLPSYPPLPNAAYNFVNKCIEPCRTPFLQTPFDGAAFVKDYILKKNAEEDSVGADQVSLAEQTAKKIDWTHKLYNDAEMCVQSMQDFSIAFWRNDLVTAIQDAPSYSQDPFEMCNKCHKRHIAWGPPRAMHDRDTCLSKLPAWFPAGNFDEPWNAFIQLINKIVEFEEIKQGRRLDPNRMVWDKSYHPKSEDWILPNRVNGGWWKCRTGNKEGEIDVPMAEKRCRLCHEDRAKEEEVIEANSKRNAAEKIRIQKWIERCMEIQMMKDRAIVEPQLRYGLE